MASSPNAAEFQEKMHRLEGLIREAEHSTDPAAKSLVQRITQALFDLHRDGLERLLERVADRDEGLLRECGEDEWIGGLLVLHDLHPLTVEERVEQAVDRFSTAGLELLDVFDGIVRLRCEPDNGTLVTELRRAIEGAIASRAPEITGVEIEGLPEATAGRFALTVL